jgi:putative transposase
MEMMELSSSTYYKEKSFSSSEKEEMEADIRGQIESVRVEFPRAGYRTLLKYLERRGIFVTEYRLRKVLKKFSLHIKLKRRFVRTTDSNHGHKVYPNLLGDHQVTKLNEAWVADITYIRIANGFVYLAVILDLHSRVVVGWQISQRIDGELALDALKMAYERRGYPAGVIHHSDRGVQYLCEKYIGFLTDHEFKISCSRKGNPYDNAFAESFMKTIKTEEVYLFNYETILNVAERIGRFIEEVYNEKRVHSSLNYLTPKEFEILIKVE